MSKRKLLMNSRVKHTEADRAAYDQEWSAYEQQLEAYEAAFEEREQTMATYEAQLASSNKASHSNASSSTTSLAMVLVAGGAVAAVAGILILLLVNNIALGFLLLRAGLFLATIGLWRWRFLEAGSANQLLNRQCKLSQLITILQSKGRLD